MSSRTFTMTLLLAVATADLAWAEEGSRATEAQPPSHTETFLSDVYEVDQLYRSMKGPQSQSQIRLGDSETTEELLWVTAYKAVMVGADGSSPMAQELMCHSNLDVDTGAHHRAVGPSRGFSPRLFTLSQGQFEVAFPPGFGIPVLSTESFRLTTQVLNLNAAEQSFQVRHKVSVEYVRDVDTERPMKALFPVGAYALASLAEGSTHYGVSTPDEQLHGSGCLPGQNAAGHTYKDPLGHTFTGHWVVPPGRQVNTTLVTHLMMLPYDTTVHYIAVHLHPFAESLELRDRTTGETVFKSKARNFDDKIGLRKVEYFESVEGLPLYRGHEYEIESLYNNTTQEDQDSMAVMYLYLRDQQFDKARVRLSTPQPAPKTVSKADEKNTD